MRCERCGGEVRVARVGYTLLYEGRLIVIENVPASVCHQCGEKFFEPRVVDQLQQVIWNQKRPVRVMETLVFDLKAA